MSQDSACITESNVFMVMEVSSTPVYVKSFKFFSAGCASEPSDAYFISGLEVYTTTSMTYSSQGYGGSYLNAINAALPVFTLASRETVDPMTYGTVPINKMAKYILVRIPKEFCSSYSGGSMGMDKMQVEVIR